MQEHPPRRQASQAVSLAEASDETLLVLFGLGNREAAATLTARLTPMAFRIALRMLAGDRAEAEDIAQEAMLRLWRQAADWRQGEARVSTWLYRVTMNLATDRLRQRRGHALDEIPDPADDRPSVVAGMMAADRMSALDRALGQLPDRQRQAVVLRHIEGLSNPEIGMILGVGVEAVESLTSRGKRSLAAMLAGRKEELGYVDD